jgi:hypothetical protein
MSATTTVRALWGWTVASGEQPVVNSYPTVPGAPTKTGLTVQDVRDYVMVPIQMYGNPPTPVSDATILSWLRFAEDEFEQGTNIRLCQTWIAAPPERSAVAMQAAGLVSASGSMYQQLGVDYDFYEPPYDFFFARAQDEGWIYQRLRWRPVQSIEVYEPAGVVDALNQTGVKNLSFIYPLLNEYFRMPNNWFVEDQTRGLIRFVPSTSVQMLPLFAMQLSFMGFAESVPGAMHFQYTAGLTANDYNSQWSFVRQAVLAMTARTIFLRMQASINLGATETQIQVDGLAYRTVYDKRGAFAGQIEELGREIKRLTQQAKTKVNGPMMGVI